MLELPSRRNRQDGLINFSQQISDLGDSIGFKISARGWCYQLEGFGLITKAKFDKVENLINTCRREGYLPIDFTAEEEGRHFSGIEIPETMTPVEYLGSVLRTSLYCEDYYTPDWWDGEDYYIQMVVEKIDLKTLSLPSARNITYRLQQLRAGARCFRELSMRRGSMMRSKGA